MLSAGCAAVEPWLSRQPSWTALEKLEELEGCVLDPPAPDVRQARCVDGVTVGRAFAENEGALGKTHGPASTRWTSRVRREAWNIALETGARVHCEDVPGTSGLAGLQLERCQSITLGTDAPLATTVGTLMPDGGAGAPEVWTWCSATTAAGAVRCDALLTRTAKTRPGRAPPAPPTLPALPHRVAVADRDVELPSSCAPSTTAMGGEARCADDVTVQWRWFPSEEPARATVQNIQAAMGLEDTPTAAFTCALVGARARCAEYTGLVGGLAWIDGKVFVALCMGPKVSRDHPACRTLISPAPRD